MEHRGRSLWLPCRILKVTVAAVKPFTACGGGLTFASWLKNAGFYPRLLRRIALHIYQGVVVRKDKLGNYDRFKMVSSRTVRGQVLHDERRAS